MIKSSNHLWNQFEKNPKDFYDHTWKKFLPPLMNDFYHPYYQAYSTQIPDTNLMDLKNGTIFLRDGVLSLVHLFARLFQSDISNYNPFAIPLSMAPIVPEELRAYFVFYNYNENTKVNINNYSKKIIFIPPVRYHINLQFLEKQLTSLENNTTLELLVVRPQLNEESYKVLAGKYFDLEFYQQGLECIKRCLPKTQLTFITSDQISNIKPLDYDYINTNHYQLFCSEDFLSHLYYLKRERSSALFSSTLVKHCSIIETIPLIKGLSLSCYKYEGETIISNTETHSLKRMRNIKRFYVPAVNDSPLQLQLFSTDIYNLALDLAEKLFYYSQGLLL